MKRLKALMLVLSLALFVSAGTGITVFADSAELSGLTVQGSDEDGNVSDVVIQPDFSPDVTEYNATVTSDIVRLELTAEAAESGASVETKWEALDEGDNESYITVTAPDGTELKYTIYTKKLTDEESETYQPEESGGSGESQADVKVDGVKMTITDGFSKADIPEGFEKTTVKYKKKEVAGITGVTKKLTAMWLEPADTADGETDDAPAAGFYIYDQDQKTFYLMQNIYVKSRMYTIVDEPEPDEFLLDYETVNVTIIDQDVKAWALDEENGLYLVYAMNWDGDKGLYCYDDIEKCFQRYIIDQAAVSRIDAANEAINDLQKKNNELVKKYNSSNGMKWKIIAALLIVIVIMFFVILNLILKRKTDRLKYLARVQKGDGYEDGRAKIAKKSRAHAEPEEEDEEIDSYEEDDDDLFNIIEDQDDDDFVILGDDDGEISADDVRDGEAKDGTDAASGEKAKRSTDADRNADTDLYTGTGDAADDFDLDVGEIDISEQIQKELEQERVSGSTGEGLKVSRAEKSDESNASSSDRARDGRSRYESRSGDRYPDDSGKNPRGYADERDKNRSGERSRDSFDFDDDDDDDGFTFI